MNAVAPARRGIAQHARFFSTGEITYRQCIIPGRKGAPDIVTEYRTLKHRYGMSFCRAETPSFSHKGNMATALLNMLQIRHQASTKDKTFLFYVMLNVEGTFIPSTLSLTQNVGKQAEPV